MSVKRTAAASASTLVIVLFGLSCATRHSTSRHVGVQEAAQSSAHSEYHSVQEQIVQRKLDELLNDIDPWPGHKVPWPHPIVYSHASWTALVSAAKILQESDPQFAEQMVRDYQRSHDHNQDDGKLLLLMRVAFDLPETKPLEQFVGFGGWRDWGGSDNMTTNAAWPISWNSGSPILVVGFTLFEGARYDAGAEFRYFVSKYPMRNLVSFSQ